MAYTTPTSTFNNMQIDKAGNYNIARNDMSFGFYDSFAYKSGASAVVNVDTDLNFQPRAISDAKGFEIRNTIVVGAAQSDFRPQVNSLMNSDLEALFIGLQGANEINFFQQARAVGLDKKLKLMAETSGDIAYQTLGKDMPQAVWTNVFWPYSLEPMKSARQSQQLLRV